MMSNLSIEEKEKLIDNTAHYIVDHGFADVAELLLKPYLPMSQIGGAMMGISIYPFAILLGDNAEKYASLAVFNTRDNIRKLLKRVKELQEEKEEKEHADNRS